jgi:cellulose synthase/poly-beta-1,6-N-acetylglucosamine synthase-like glycosyltransferase
MIMTEYPLVSITVCVRDGVEWIDSCLESLVNQDWPNIEVIAVDDGSCDGSRELLQKWHDPDAQQHSCSVRILSQAPLGLSAGRMNAVNETKGKWVAITDIDVRPEETWISQLMDARNPIDDVEKVVAVTGRTIFEGGTNIVSRLRSAEISAKYRSRPRRTSLANGPCSIFLKQALLDCGGFNPEWYHAEDMEVSLRLISEGGTIVYTPDAVVNHVAEDSLFKFLTKRTRDARAHVRIVRHFPRKKWSGPNFDFIGSSWAVLAMFPLQLLQLLMIARLVNWGTAGFELSIDAVEMMLDSLYFCVGLLAFFINHGLRFFYGPHRSLGVSIWQPMKMAKIYKVVNLWGFALWKGLALGYLDALLGRNGHRKTKEK